MAPYPFAFTRQFTTGGPREPGSVEHMCAEYSISVQPEGADAIGRCAFLLLFQLDATKLLEHDLAQMFLYFSFCTVLFWHVSGDHAGFRS